jgi:glycosyltransferase involved in cell wall biosynthesis
MEQSLKVSIVTTAYNVEEYIKKCLESILGQTYKNIEVIVVNDFSQDCTSDILKSFNDERLRVINHKRNMGAGQARKTGIEASTGDYVITIDGDDWISEDFIETLVKNAVETNADIVSGGITIVQGDNYEEIKRFLPKVSTGFQKFKDYGNKKIIFLNNKLVKRSLYDIVPYSTRRYCEDTPVILPLLYYANSVSYADTQGYYYLQHDQSLCHRVNRFEEALFKALCSKDCMAFFSDKEDEYKCLISQQEFFQYLLVLKQTITPQLAEIYKEELGELTPVLLKMMS